MAKHRHREHSRDTEPELNEIIDRSSHIFIVAIEIDSRSRFQRFPNYFVGSTEYDGLFWNYNYTRLFKDRNCIYLKLKIERTVKNEKSLRWTV